jgi:hypothetical protein
LSFFPPTVLLFVILAADCPFVCHSAAQRRNPLLTVFPAYFCSEQKPVISTEAAHGIIVSKRSGEIRFSTSAVCQPYRSFEEAKRPSLFLKAKPTRPQPPMQMPHST